MKHIIYLWVFGILSIPSFSHPVIWKNGSVISSSFKSTVKSIYAHHSLSHRFALGFHGIDIKGSKYAMLQSNVLVKRWNQHQSQANIYLFSGIGSGINDSQNAVLHIGTQFDWETRKLYTQFSAHSYISKNRSDILSARVGFSPYLAEYDGIHTWVILQVDDLIQNHQHHMSIMPVLRIFKHNVLFELGYDFHSDYLLTAMFHF